MHFERSPRACLSITHQHEQKTKAKTRHLNSMLISAFVLTGTAIQRIHQLFAQSAALFKMFVHQRTHAQ